jgi:DNA-binding response OmpR family regulator
LRTPHVLFLTDDADICRLLFPLLQESGVDAVLTTSLEDALARWHEGRHDLIVVDVETGSLDGASVCGQLRAEVVNPIILAAHEHDERAIIAAYEAGVDDYIAKPIGLRLYCRKIMAWLRHAGTVPAHLLQRLELGPFALYAQKRQMQLIHEDGSAIRLTNLEFRLLHLLMSHEGQVLEADFIADRVWGSLHAHSTTALKSVVYRVRQKLEPVADGTDYLQTVAGKGYTFRSR